MQYNNVSRERQDLGGSRGGWVAPGEPPIPSPRVPLRGRRGTVGAHGGVPNVRLSLALE
jgi:hypothetical protein